MESKVVADRQNLARFSSINRALEKKTNPKKVVQEILALADININGDRPSDILVHDERFYTRLIQEGSLALGETYMEGWWDSNDLSESIAKIIRADLEHQIKPSWRLCWHIIKFKYLNMQSKGWRSSQVVKNHYELGDDLYKNMLGGTLAYTCAYWKNASTLDEAQVAKFELVAKKMELKAGMRVLDIGCGWGDFSHHIAKNYGVEVVAVNLSSVQAAYLKNLCKGLPVTVQVQDYRDIKGTFDRVISIGLMEHVGAKNYREFMQLIHDSLSDDGLALVHTIGRDTTALTVDPWIHRYIFPNGYLPSPTQISKSIEGLFVMEDWHNFSSYYDRTLMSWFHNFEQNWHKIKDDYPDPFYRMWSYYLLACAGGFRARSMQLWQIVLSKKGVLGGYDSIR